MLCTVQLYSGLQWSSLLIDVCVENFEEEVSPTMVLQASTSLFKLLFGVDQTSVYRNIMYKKSFLLNEGGMANYEKQVEQEAAYPIFGLSLIIFPHLITILKSWPNHRNQKQPTCSQVNIPIMRLTNPFPAILQNSFTCSSHAPFEV